MKFRTYILSYCIILITTVSIAQPTINENALPTIGTNVPAVYYQGELDLGENGPNRTWVFEPNVAFEILATNFLIIPVEEAPYNELFPDADMVIAPGTLDVFNFIRVEGDELQNLGFAFGDDSYGLTYTILNDGEAIGKWPLNYEDTFVTETMFSSYLGGMKVDMGTRSKTATVDSYGTVTTPYGTWDNVLKVSIVNNDTPDALDQVLFLHPTSFLPIVNYAISNTDATLTSYTFLDINKLSTKTIEESNDNIKIALTEYNMHINSDQLKHSSSVQLFDLSGNLIIETKYTNQTNDHIIPIENLTTGMYILTIVTDEKLTSRKIFIP